jgi:hypothetical protein
LLKGVNSNLFHRNADSALPKENGSIEKEAEWRSRCAFPMCLRKRVNSPKLFNSSEAAVAALKREEMEAEVAAKGAGAESDEELDVGIETDDLWAKLFGVPSHEKD